MNIFQATIDRYPVVAGQYYPAKPDELQKELTNLFAQAEPAIYQDVRAIISPHAGFEFSGKVAASAYNQVAGETRYKRIFLLGSSHQTHFDGATVYCDGDYVMPYGKERVDTVVGQELVKKYPDIFTANPRPHQKEHSLEVQLPFLHETIKTEYGIVPIIIGSSDQVVCQWIANSLKPWFTPENLFIISTDFSHYPSDTDARKVDTQTKDAIVSNNPERLLTTLMNNSKAGYHNLVTSLCGWTSVLTLMYLTAGDTNIEYHALDYSNSSDSPLYGEKDRVVGYWAITISKKEDVQKE